METYVGVQALLLLGGRDGLFASLIRYSGGRGGCSLLGLLGLLLSVLESLLELATGWNADCDALVQRRRESI